MNEAIADDGSGLRDTVFRRKLGDGYIAEVFRLARQADPTALLFYNDYGGEGLNSQVQSHLRPGRSLLAQGVPIDGVGLQMHITARIRQCPGHGVEHAQARRSGLAREHQ